MKKNIVGRNAKARVQLPVKIKKEFKEELVLKTPPNLKPKNKRAK